MNISLTPHFEELIQEKVSSGSYSNASEVIRDALRLLEARDLEHETKLAALRGAIPEGLNSGEAQPWEDAAIINQIREQQGARQGKA